MKLVYQTLTLLPAPLFFLGFLYSVLNPPALCTAFPYEMAAMWAVMGLAHLVPWLLFWQQRNLTRN
jgi:protein-S-isoprenylcysteine O-methyltransferase Ste14